MNTESAPPTYTPGPWIIDTGEVPQLGEALGVLKQSHKPGEKGESICVVALAKDAEPHDHANARLIAAAPVMLSVLQDIQQALAEDEDYGNRVCEWNFEGGTPLEMVEWAIREAIGQNVRGQAPGNHGGGPR